MNCNKTVGMGITCNFFNCSRALYSWIQDVLFLFFHAKFLSNGQYCNEFYEFRNFIMECS